MSRTAIADARAIAAAVTEDRPMRAPDLLDPGAGPRRRRAGPTDRTPSSAARSRARRPTGRRPRPARIGRPDAAARPQPAGGWWLGPGRDRAWPWPSSAGSAWPRGGSCPGRDAGPLRVVGRTSLSPKHSVYLLRVGDRVLIVGTGPQGPPSLLGEVTDPAELARLAPALRDRRRRPGPRRARPSTGFDRRIGDDE